MVASPIVVGMADIHVVKGEAMFSCLGLGSCIGLAILDPVTHVAGMIHIMLPEAFADRPVDQPGKFADTGIVELFKQFESHGGSMRRVVAAMAGGAQVFNFGANSNSRMDIGARNAMAVSGHLSRLNIRPIATDTGGNLGRTVHFDSKTGLVRVKTVSMGEKQLCSLRAS